MSILNYDTRTRMVFDFLYRDPDGVLRRYRAPEYLGDDQLRAEVKDLVEDINREIPNGFTNADFRLLMPEIHRSIRRRHAAQGWPPAKTFIMATQEAAEKVNTTKARAIAEANPKERSLDTQKIWAKRMQAGEAVAETFLWGREAVEMIDRGLIDQATLDAYRKSAYAMRAEPSGSEEADRWLAEVEARHEAAERTWGAQSGKADHPEMSPNSAPAAVHATESRQGNPGTDSLTKKGTPSSGPHSKPEERHAASRAILKGLGVSKRVGGSSDH